MNNSPFIRFSDLIVSSSITAASLSSSILFDYLHKNFPAESSSYFSSEYTKLWESDAINEVDILSEIRGKLANQQAIVSALSPNTIQSLSQPNIKQYPVVPSLSGHF